MKGGFYNFYGSSWSSFWRVNDLYNYRRSIYTIRFFCHGPKKVQKKESALDVYTIL